MLTKVEHAVKVEPVGEFELKGIRRPLAAYNVVGVGLSVRELDALRCDGGVAIQVENINQDGGMRT